MQNDSNLNLIAVVVCGSRLFRTHMSNSDYDYRTVFFETPRQLFGFKPAVNFKSKSEADTQNYPLKNFISMCMNGNPNLMDVLYSDCVVKSSPAWEKIQSVRDKFISVKTLNGMMGFKREQESISRQGKFDNKAASHVIRLLFTALNFMETGMFSPVLSGEQINVVKEVKYSDSDREFYFYYDWLNPKTEANFAACRGRFRPSADEMFFENFLIELEIEELKKHRL